MQEDLGDYDKAIAFYNKAAQHDLLDKGKHGEFRAEDLFIPYVIYNGGLYE